MAVLRVISLNWGSSNVKKGGVSTNHRAQTLTHSHTHSYTYDFGLTEKAKVSRGNPNFKHTHADRRQD